MAVDMFIKIDTIEGESKDKSHGKEIDVLAWSWGMSQSGSAQMGPGMGSGKVNIQDLSFTKYMDASSSVLMLACCNGQHIKEATLVVRKAGENPLEYLKIKLNDLIITNISTGGSGGEDRLTENITLNFAKVAVDYTAQNAQGGAAGTYSMTWDIPANSK